jgi:hypothetical protein
MSGAKKMVGNDTADVSGAAGDKNTHRTPLMSPQFFVASYVRGSKLGRET